MIVQNNILLNQVLVIERRSAVVERRGACYISKNLNGFFKLKHFPNLFEPSLIDCNQSILDSPFHKLLAGLDRVPDLFDNAIQMQRLLIFLLQPIQLVSLDQFAFDDRVCHIFVYLEERWTVDVLLDLV